MQGREAAVLGSLLGSLFSLLRSANLSAEKCSYNEKYLRKSDFVEGNAIPKLTVAVLKSNRFLEERITLALPKTGGKLCPTLAICKAIAEVRQRPSDSLFASRFGNKVVPLTASRFSALLKTVLSKTTFTSDGYSTHSFRRGGTTSLLCSE